MRCANEAALAIDGHALILEMCRKCIEERQSACETCAVIHKKLDAVEAAMPRNILMEPFKFERTVAEQSRLLKINTDNNICRH